MSTSTVVIYKMDSTPKAPGGNNVRGKLRGCSTELCSPPSRPRFEATSRKVGVPPLDTSQKLPCTEGGPSHETPKLITRTPNGSEKLVRDPHNMCEKGRHSNMTASSENTWVDVDLSKEPQSAATEATGIDWADIPLSWFSQPKLKNPQNLEAEKLNPRLSAFTSIGSWMHYLLPCCMPAE